MGDECGLPDLPRSINCDARKLFGVINDCFFNRSIYIHDIYLLEIIYILHSAKVIVDCKSAEIRKRMAKIRMSIYLFVEVQERVKNGFNA